MTIDSRFWNGSRWNGHAAFQTVHHIHVSFFAGEGEKSCDLAVIECADHRWYVEDSWDGDAEGAAGVWNPYKPEADEPTFYATEEAAIRHAATVVATVCGVPVSRVWPGLPPAPAESSPA